MYGLIALAVLFASAYARPAPGAVRSKNALTAPFSNETSPHSPYKFTVPVYKPPQKE